MGSKAEKVRLGFHAPDTAVYNSRTNYRVRAVKGFGMGEAPSKVEQPEERLVPSTWGDLFLYLFGGGGAFLAAGLGVSLLFEEINFGLTMTALLLNVVFLGGSVYLLGIRRGKISWKSLGLFPPVWEARYIGWAFLLIVTLFPIRVCAGFLVERFLSGNLESLELRRQLLYVDNLPKFLALLIGGGILVPISEELFFRGLLYNWLRQRYGLMASVLVSSTLFGLAHFDSAAVLVASFLVAIAIALAYEATGSMWMPILIHTMNNSISLGLMYVLQAVQEYLPPGPPVTN